MKSPFKAALIASFYVLIASRITPAADLLNTKADATANSSINTPVLNSTSNKVNVDAVEAPTSQEVVPPSQKISPKLRRKQCLNENPKMTMEELKACATGKSK